MERVVSTENKEKVVYWHRPYHFNIINTNRLNNANIQRHFNVVSSCLALLSLICPHPMLSIRRMQDKRGSIHFQNGSPKAMGWMQVAQGTLLLVVGCPCAMTNHPRGLSSTQPLRNGLACSSSPVSALAGHYIWKALERGDWEPRGFIPAVPSMLQAEEARFLRPAHWKVRNPLPNSLEKMNCKWSERNQKRNSAGCFLDENAWWFLCNKHHVEKERDFIPLRNSPQMRIFVTAGLLMKPQ